MNNRKLPILTLTLALSLFCISCHQKAPQQEADWSVFQMPEQVEAPDSAMVYETSFWDGKQYPVADSLVKGELTETTDWAYGTQYIYQDGNQMCSIVTGNEKASFGSLSYVDFTGTPEGLEAITSAELKLDSLAYGGRISSNQAYGTSDLSFSPMIQERESVLNIFPLWDLSLSVVEEYAYDMDTLEKRYAEYIDYLENLPRDSTEAPELPLKPEKEAYRFFLAQEVDGITVAPYSWNAAPSNPDYTSGSFCTVTATDQGIVELFLKQMISPPEKESGEKQSLMDYQEALSIFRSGWDDPSVLRDSALYDAGLYYVIENNKQDPVRCTLRPAWIFVVISPDPYDTGEAEEKGQIVKFYVIDAVSGKWIYKGGLN